jgi:hypothetical protein
MLLISAVKFTTRVSGNAAKSRLSFFSDGKDSSDTKKDHNKADFFLENEYSIKGPFAATTPAGPRYPSDW